MARLPDASYVVRVVDGNPTHLHVTVGPSPELTVMSVDHLSDLTLEKGNALHKFFSDEWRGLTKGET